MLLGEIKKKAHCDFSIINLRVSVLLKLFTTQSRHVTTLKKASKNTVVKGDNAGNQHCLPLPQCFLFYQRGKKS